MLSRDQILAAVAKPRPTETVSVPEWGGDVIVTVMTGFERDAWEADVRKMGRDSFWMNARARLASRCVVDESGARVLSDDDVVELGKSNWLALERVCDVAQRLNRLTDAAMEELKGN